MVANILNVLVGLWLSYVAIFGAPEGNMGHALLLVAAAAVIVLAIFARRSDFSGWQSATNLVLGAILLVFAFVVSATAVPPLVAFWLELWIGLAVAIFALWAALYHPERQRTGDGSI